MARKIGLIVFIIILSGASIWAYHNYSVRPLEPIQASGIIEATTVDISARAPGTVVRLALQEGQTVSRDQLVAELSRSDLSAQKERDAMGVAAAQAKLDDLQSGARTQELEEARSNTQIAVINLDKAKRDLARAESLFAAGAISQESLEQSRNNADQKSQLLEVAQARQNSLEAGSRPQQIKAAAAELERNKAILKASQNLLADLQLFAPLNGTVLSRNYEVGEFVQIGSSLGTIADLNHMWIKVYIPTDDLPRIKLGQKVYFTVSGDSHRYSGTVSNIASKGEFTPKMIQTPKERTNIVFAVKISFANKDGALKIGMPADVVFDEGL
ncbi:MAG: HlyD family efflux transporter periplasmic adaptor subunit [Syntrophomonadaceae bacterium]|nr:HlyD family efflux transporter periplasmic adaptor subunit [Syntrophomonadaceae bacterium]